ncbi:FRG domain-containing protein [Pseudomonas fitomaticsae]|uniref:FRG domain-containing protein n=1 Tax=Pseudomonas fitomaticsae TaxID=2837969 RepID=A0ABY3PVR2_9PSED|nr:FRG domain-containing protein [Pseudomonas fitomaticsae]UFP97704.1 FRG domain-containing protein [Pseudomonas fitomaticsae]
MRQIESNVTELVKNKIGNRRVAEADAVKINNYRELVEEIAKLSYLNKDYLLFFRGQNYDYRNKAGSSTFYPSIYRGDYLSKKEVRHRFDILQGASRLLVDAFESRKLPGTQELKRKKYIQWSILQHYEVCGTPLIDFTHSIRVACSFALNSCVEKSAFVFVFGLPYITNRVSHNSEHDLVNIRLLSICPPSALRPYFQDGYLVGTEDVLDEYESKQELDFNNRLLAKYEIPNSSDFWGKQFPPIPQEALYPENDQVLDICKDLKFEADRELQSGDVGDFLKAWSEVESLIVGKTVGSRKRFTPQAAIRAMCKEGLIPKSLEGDFHNVRRFRNELVHAPNSMSASKFSLYMKRVRELKAILSKVLVV